MNLCSRCTFNTSSISDASNIATCGGKQRKEWSPKKQLTTVVPISPLTDVALVSCLVMAPAPHNT